VTALLASALVERALAVVGVLLVVGLLARCAIAARPAEPLLDRLEASLTPARERLWIALVLLCALLMRTALWDRDLNAPYWFAETTQLWVARALTEGHLARQWLELLTTFDAAYPHRSALMMPVATAFQVIFGPVMHLAVLVGAFWGVLGVLLAWLLGRALEGRVFGLVFAALVAASPLQLVWSRSGGIYVSGPAHVLLVLWLGHLAGRRRSIALAVVTGIAAWCSLYQYYAARVAIPLGFVAMIHGLRRAHTTFPKAVGVLGAGAFTLCAIFVAFRHAGVSPALWPTYGGYLGNKGERTLADLVMQNAAEAGRQLRAALERYFLYTRAIRGDRTLGWGMQRGGLCFAPVALLGAVGLLGALRHPVRAFPWLALMLAGLALPVLSVTTARRLLLFDLGWCALAALGILAVLPLRCWRTLSVRTANGITVGGFLFLAGWSFASMALLTAAMPERAGQPIPFGESGFGDGIACLRCVHAGEAWRTEIARGEFIVLFDSDLEREDRACPGGLPLYGKQAAFAAGRNASFVEFYSLVQNFDAEPPVAGAVFDRARTDFASHLAERVRLAAPASIVWHFEEPTQWETWLSEQLRAAGGELETFATPLSRLPGIRVRTPPERALALLRDLADRQHSEDRVCALISRELREVYPWEVWHIAPEPNTDSERTSWLVGGWGAVARGAQTLPVHGPNNLQPDPDGRRFRILTRLGLDVGLDVSRWQLSEQRPLGPARVGFDCAVYHRSAWWIVDPVTGTVSSTDGDSAWLPAGRWVGIAATPDGSLALASADQTVVLVRPEERREIARFPADVWPSRRATFGECSLVLAGDGWYATFNPLLSALTLYDRRGERVGVCGLDRVLGLGAHRITAIGATGRHIGVGISTQLETLALSSLTP